MKSHLYAVLTGDVINSGERNDYGRSLDRTFAQFQQHYQDDLVLEVDRYSGDQFQVLLASLRKSLRAALYLFTRLASLEDPLEVRISIGLGSIRTLPEQRVSNGDGAAFRLSGTNLDKMNKRQRVTFAASKDVMDREVSRVLRGAFDLLSALLEELSSTQAEVLWFKLRDYTQEEIAQETNRRQQSVSDISIAARWPYIEPFLTMFETELTSLPE